MVEGERGGLLQYPSEGDHVEGVLSPVDGVQEVAVGDLRTRKHLQLAADTNRKYLEVITASTEQGCACVCVCVSMCVWPPLDGAVGLDGQVSGDVGLPQLGLLQGRVGGRGGGRGR